jgi:single-strand DNA-binding protein
MINSVVLAGNVVADPMARSTSTGKSIASFRLAVNNPINDKDTVFIDVDVWEKQAEFVTTHVKKGSSVSVIGRLKQDSWEKDGEKKTKILVVADRVNFVGGKKKDGAETEDAPPAPRAAARPAAKAPTKAAPAKPAPVEADEDEVPI